MGERAFEFKITSIPLEALKLKEVPVLLCPEVPVMYVARNVYIEIRG